MVLAKGTDRGFTLAELMVVVLIIGILTSIAIPVFFSVKSRAAQNTCRANMTAMERAYEQYKVADEIVQVPENQGPLEKFMTAMRDAYDSITGIFRVEPAYARRTRRTAQSYSEAVAILVPEYVKTPPVCKDGGTYTASNTAGVLSISCSKHGRRTSTY